MMVTRITIETLIHGRETIDFEGTDLVLGNRAGLWLVP